MPLNAISSKYRVDWQRMHLNGSHLARRIVGKPPFMRLFMSHITVESPMLLPVNAENHQNRVEWHEMLPVNGKTIDNRVDWQCMTVQTTIRP
ncbi:hypothetical protein [Bifidobacterium callitrichos]|uniref:hypothetical protein n=1 Tax=Bifidobacterium callitrichos TaxID=762209 RepID=UPI001269D83C|nr:hypothetical protein [Bifidobacterium callitrichos]